MANNLRTLKKDVKYLVEEVIGDVDLFMNFNPGVKVQEAGAIVDDAIELYFSMIDRINNVQDNPVKPYYAAIKKDLIEGIDKLFDRISQLAKKEA